MKGSYPSYEGVPHMRGSWNSQYCMEKLVYTNNDILKLVIILSECKS